MSQQTIRSVVRERYGAIARGEGQGCCGPECCGSSSGTDASLGVGYTAEELASLPPGADLGLGSGHPTGAANLGAGEVVLDLGSGAGIDCFLASVRVGPEGSVIGVDMTPDMVSRARDNAREGGFENVEFRLGEVEALPVSDNAVDVVISNCVLNLSDRRQEALEEAFRVLKPGGRLVVSDLVSDVRTPEFVAQFPELVGGCLPVPREDYVRGLEAAGFTDVVIVDERPYPREQLPVDAELAARMRDAGTQLGDLDAYLGSARSATIRAWKPGATADQDGQVRDR